MSDQNRNYIISSSTECRNLYWQVCKRRKIPFIAVRRSRWHSLIDWDFWTIDVAGLGLSASAVGEMDAYVEELFKDRKAVEGTLHTGETGFVKVRRDFEREVLSFITKLVCDRLNWSKQP